MENYVLVYWPESQDLMDQPWFEECMLAVDIESSAYFVPQERYNELMRVKPKVYITVRGGTVVSVGSNVNIDYCIVDHDVEREDKVLGVHPQDYTNDFFYNEFRGDQQIYDELKERNF